MTCVYQNARQDVRSAAAGKICAASISIRSLTLTPDGLYDPPEGAGGVPSGPIKTEGNQKAAIGFSF